MGLGSFISKMFGGGGNKRDTTYTGAKPASNLGLVPQGQSVIDRYKNWASGQGYGYDKNYASKTSSPIIKQSRSNFEGYALPEQKAYNTQMGLKGTSGSSLMNKLYNQQQEKEGVIHSDLYREAEQARIRGEELGQTGLHDVANTNANLLDRYAAFDWKDYQNQLTREDTRRATRKDDVGKAWDAAAAMAGAAGGMAGGAGGMSAMPSMLPKTYGPGQYASTYGTQNIPNIVGAKQTTGSGSVVDKMMKLLQAGGR